MEGPSNLLTAADVGRILHRHPKVILRLAREGRLSHVRLGYRGVRFRLTDIEAYIAAHVVEAAS